MDHYEYVGEVLPGGKLSIAPSLIRELVPGQKVKIRLEQIADPATGSPMKKEPDRATMRILQRMENAPQLGGIHGILSREEFYGDRIDEKY